MPGQLGPGVPGVATATEMQMALEAGIEVVKVFPAEALAAWLCSRLSPRLSP